MPMSSLLHLPAVIHFAQAISPRRTIDIGVGNGTYGFMLRQALDIGYERLTRESWKVTIDGVEIFEGYRNPVWDYAYDNVWRQDVREHVKEMGTYDLGLCNDVLEHFELQEAKELVGEMLNKCRAVIVTTPNVDLPQSTWGGNEAEAHKCLITRKDLPAVVVEKKTGITSVYVCSIDANTVNAIKAAAGNCPVCRPAPWRKLREQAARVGRLLRRAVIWS